MATNEQRKARLELSRRFLDEVLLPSINNMTIAGVEDIPVLIGKFRTDNNGLGADFDPAHVWLEAYQRDLLNERNEEAGLGISDDASDLVVAVCLLEELIFPTIV